MDPRKPKKAGTATESDVATLEARYAALIAERNTARAQHDSAQKAATAALVEGTPDRARVVAEAGRVEHELRMLDGAVTEVERQLPRARWMTAAARATAHFEAAAKRGAGLVQTILAAQAKAQQGSAALVEAQDAEDEARRALAWEIEGVKVLAAMFEMTKPVLPSPPAAIDVIQAPLAVAMRTSRGSRSFDVVTGAGATPEERRAAALNAVRSYVNKYARSLPRVVMQIIEAAGGVPQVPETERARELREEREEQRAHFAEELSHLPPASGTRHGL
jgi:hypothetical protein